MYETAQEVLTHTLKLNFTIQAKREVVWRGLTSDLGRWFPKDALAGPEGSLLRLELKPGGKMVEEWPDGGGLVWGEVTTIQPNTMLQMTGELFPDWGGPAYSFRTYKLSDDGESCRLEFEECSIGSLNESTLKSLEEGWVYLYGEQLRQWCEKQAKTL